MRLSFRFTDLMLKHAGTFFGKIGILVRMIETAFGCRD